MAGADRGAAKRGRNGTLRERRQKEVNFIVGWLSKISEGLGWKEQIGFDGQVLNGQIGIFIQSQGRLPDQGFIGRGRHKLQGLGKCMMKDVKYPILKILGEPGETEDLDEKFQEKQAKEEVKSVEER